MTRRDDPLGKQALFTSPPGARHPSGPGAGESGRRAMFSAPDVAVQSEAGAASAASETAVASGAAVASGPVRLECRSCRVVSPLGMTSLVRALVPSLWIPLRPWSRVLRCPACRRWTLARISWWPKPAGSPAPEP